jgi:uncharacterized integral membrane protein
MNSDISSYITIIGVVLIVIIVLLVVVVLNQQKKINDLKPRYGFLGKPLAIVLMSTFAVGTLGLVYYSSTQPVQIEQTNADVEVILTISAEPTGNSSREYRISVTPVLSGIAWGANDTNKFNVYWTISTGSIVLTEDELNKSYTNPSTIIKKLSAGETRIKATVFFNGKSFTKEKTVTVEWMN